MLLKDPWYVQGCSKEALHSLQSALQSSQRASKTAPGLDVRLLVAPVIASALQDLSPEMSDRLLHALMPQRFPLSERRQDAPVKQPLKRALFLEPQHSNRAAPGASPGSSSTAEWHQRALSQISAHVSSANATQLAALIRSLPISQALDRISGPLPSSTLPTAVPLSHSSVLLAYLMKALPAAGASDMPELPAVRPHAEPYQAGSASHDSAHFSSNWADKEQAAKQQLGSEAAGEGSEGLAEEAYRRCRKHLKQLEAGHLAALLRFWLLQGPCPVSGIPGSRPELRGALRLCVLQDGIAACARHLGKARQADSPAADANEQSSEVSHELLSVSCEWPRWKVVLLRPCRDCLASQICQRTEV